MQNSLDAQEVEQATQPRSDDGFREVFATHRLGLFRLAVLLVGDVHAAEEITAEVFARVLPKWRAGVVLEPLPYLRRAVVNETRSRHRRRRTELRALTQLGSRAAIGHQPDR